MKMEDEEGRFSEHRADVTEACKFDSDVLISIEMHWWVNNLTLKH